MNNPVTDSQLRHEALDPTRSFIVQAPAGSGKTELLTRRILTLLVTVDEPEEILAITFTRKAATEMRQRVIDTLIQAQSLATVQNEYQQQGRLLADAVIQRDRERNWQLLNKPSRLSMQTIDSFCAMLTRQLPVSSNFGAELNVIEDASRLYAMTAQRCIEENLQSPDSAAQTIHQLLLYFDNNVERLQRLLSGMLANRDQWLRHYSQAGSREGLEADLRQLVSKQLSQLAQLIPVQISECLPRLIQMAATASEGLDLDNAARYLSELRRIPAPDFESGVQWQLIADFLLTKTGQFRKRLSRNEGFPTSAKDASDLGLTVAELKQRKAEFLSLYQTLTEVEGLQAALGEIQSLPMRGYTDEQWQIMESLLHLLTLAVAELHLVFAEQNQVDFTEIALRATRSLGESEAPTDLALALDYKLKHVLIDEFQDTSISQFQLFEKLLAGWTPDDGRSFFAVGDPMQSIYRFRDAEVSLFIRAWQHGIAGIALTPLQLQVNFRSDKSIIEWCNQTFSAVFPAQSDLTTGAVQYAASQPFHSDANCNGVTFHPCIDSNRVNQAEQVAEVVSSRLASIDNAEKKIAILVRSKSVLPEIVTALQQRSIRYSAVDIETLGERLVVKDILSLCRALQHPFDHVHWCALLRAPWCGLSLHDLHALVHDRSARTVWSVICDDQNLQCLSADGQQRVEHLRTALQPALARAMREPLAPWVESIWLHAGGPASCVDEHDFAAAEACFDELSAIEDAGLLWDSTYVAERMNQLYAPSALESSQVHIMTIHKSKGLEFDTVILPGLERPPRADDTRLLNWFEYFDEAADPRLLLAPIAETNQEASASSPITNLVKRLQKRKSENELLRLLYVAATRAKQQLHLVASASSSQTEKSKKPPKSSLLAPIWSLVENAFDVAEQSVNQDDANLPDPEPPLLYRIQQQWMKPDFTKHWLHLESALPSVLPESGLQIPDAIEFDWASANARHIGTVIHQQIQRIADDGIGNWSQQRIERSAQFYRALLQSQGMPTAVLDTAANSVCAGLCTLLADKRGRWLLDPTHKLAKSEYRLSGISDDHLINGIIDRTFVDEADVRWIVDYKTGYHSGGQLEAFLDREQMRYCAQLERYAGIMRNIEQREIRLGLYFPLLGGWREWKYNA